MSNLKTFENFDEDPFGDAIADLPTGDSKKNILRNYNVAYSEIKTCPNYQKIIQDYDGKDFASKVQIKNKTVKIAVKNPISKKTFYYLAYCTGDLRKDDPELAKVTTLNEWPRPVQTLDEWNKLLGQLIQYIEKDFGKAKERLEYESFKENYHTLVALPEFKELMKNLNCITHFLGKYGFGIKLPLTWKWNTYYNEWRSSKYLLLYLFPSGNTLFEKNTEVRAGKRQWQRIGDNKTVASMLSNVKTACYIYQRNFKPQAKPTHIPPPESEIK